MKIFKEEQRFTQIWLIIILLICMIIPIALITEEYSHKHSAMSTAEFITTIITIVFFSSLIFFFKLITRIDEKGIHYRFFPFHFSFKLIPWQDLSSAHTRKYNAMIEYGGWGLRGGFFLNKSKGTAYNVSGNIGIQLKLLNGKKILIGTHKRDAADRVLKNYEHKITPNEK